MKSHWSCSKIADWIRGTQKPFAGTANEWSEWEKGARMKSWRYWLAEEGLDHMQDFIYWPMKHLNNVRIYIKNRWINKSHTLTSNLKRGEWHDFDTRLLYAAFDELVNFVEIELAWIQVISSEDEKKKYKISCFKRWRCPAAGIAYLEWARELKYGMDDGVDKTDYRYGQLTPQALAAQEISVLYNWWKYEYPNRPEPMESSGWIKYCEDRVANGNDLLDINRNEKEREESRKLVATCHEIEQEQFEEDTSMLVRLIKVRQHLWT
jgi:hypothetical protein